MHRQLRIGINGFGRIGRRICRLALENPGFTVVAINDLADPKQNQHLLQYDSVHGTFSSHVELQDNVLKVRNTTIPLLQKKDPATLPWGEYDCDVVLECTGAFTSYDKASQHKKGGAKRIIVSAPVKDSADVLPTFVVGVNHASYAGQDIVSNASCTTNCLAPVVSVLHETFGIERGLMTTVHSYTNDQRVLDLTHSDYRRMRAAALNLIPTSTGAAKAVGLVIPALQGKLTGISVRVPTPNVSLVDFVADLRSDASVDIVNAALEKAAGGPLRNILSYTRLPMVSSDFNGNLASSVVDALATQVVDDRMVKVLAWYDNETGFSARMLDLASYITLGKLALAAPTSP